MNIDILKEMQELFSAPAGKKVISLFVQELLAVLGGRFREQLEAAPGDEQTPKLERIEKWVDIINRRYQEHNMLNLQAQLFIQNLYYQMKA